jgi:diamine N-acetyltransferase
MSELGPFAEPRYALGECALRPLDAREAPLLASALASMDPWLTFGYSAERFSSYLTRPDPALRQYVIAVGPELAGVVAVRYPWLHGAYLELLGVLRPFQGRGLGAEVVQWFESQSFQVAPNAWILVSAFNTRARKFYTRLGFVELATLPDFLKPGQDEILLRKQKPSPALQT